jgi:putative ABC transport system permease protein
VGFAERFTTRAQEIRLDGTVLLFAALTSILAGIVFGAVPGWWVGGRVRRSAMDSAVATVGARGRAIQRALVVGQVAVAFSVVSAAGLALRTLQAVASTELGFETESVVSLEVAVDKERWQSTDSARVLFDRIAARVALEPAVGSVARTMGTPLSGHTHRDAYFFGGGAEGTEPATALSRVVDPGFFEILGMDLVEGRSFRPSDGPDAPPVAVVNRSFHERFMADRYGLGSILTRCHGPGACLAPMEVVGVVEDVRFDGPDEAVGPEVYQVARQQSDYGGEHLLLAVRGDPVGLEPAIVARIHEVDPDLAVSDYGSLEGLRRARTHPRRFLAGLLGALAAVAAGLAVTGIFGVASLSAASRTRELGIRRALGATPRSLTGRVVTEGLAVAGVGIVVGGALAWVFGAAFARFFQTVLWGVAPRDPLTLGATATLFVAVAVAATWGPARRVAGLDVMKVLQEP